MNRAPYELTVTLTCVALCCIVGRSDMYTIAGLMDRQDRASSNTEACARQTLAIAILQLGPTIAYTQVCEL